MIRQRVHTGFHQVGPNAGIACTTWSAVGWGDDDRARADEHVRLAAAAPALRDALRTALVVVAGINGDGYFNHQEREIRAALALADGGTAR